MRRTAAGVNFLPEDIVRRRIVGWRGAATEVVQIIRHERFEYLSSSPFHLLIAAERADQLDGEIEIGRLLPLRLLRSSRRLTFVPAGQHLRGWSDPRILARFLHFYIDPHSPLLDPELGFADIEFRPRLFFDDSAIWSTVVKLGSLIEDPKGYDRFYAEALIALLAQELVRVNGGVVHVEPPRRGGLAGWQRNRLVQYIEAHLAEPISLTTLAGLVRLSRFHFARAFKCTFDAPPHHYLTQRRITRAKELLATSTLTVTETALNVGYYHISAFTAAFSRLTGCTPTRYRRGLE